MAEIGQPGTAGDPQRQPRRSSSEWAYEDELRLLIEGVREYAIVMLDPDGYIKTWNRGAERIKGYTAEEIIDKHFSTFYLPLEAESGHPQHELEIAEAVGRYEEEGWRVRKDGSRFWAHVLITALFSEEGELRGFGKLVRDVSDQRNAEVERQRLVDELQAATRTDDLTDMPNRRAWDEELPRELARARRYKVPVCVAMLDLDHFKDFNDRFGHTTGDEMLRETAASWETQLRATDLIARYGGEEFTALFPNCTLEDATAILERIREVTPARMTVSVGVACWDGSESQEQLFERADRALYDAKHQGRDRLVIAAPAAPPKSLGQRIA